MALDAAPIVCIAPKATDGDTLRCENLARTVRLLATDACETRARQRREGCTRAQGYAATAALRRILARGRVTVTPMGCDTWGRRYVARVYVNGRDVGDMLVAGGWAVRVPGYAGACRG